MQIAKLLLPLFMAVVYAASCSAGALDMPLSLSVAAVKTVQTPTWKWFLRLGYHFKQSQGTCAVDF